METQVDELKIVFAGNNEEHAKALARHFKEWGTPIKSWRVANRADHQRFIPENDDHCNRAIEKDAVVMVFVKA